MDLHSFEEYQQALTTISRLTGELSASSDAVLTPQERVDLYVIALGVEDELRTAVRNALYPDAIDALADLGVPEGGTAATPYAWGVRRTTVRKPGRVEWSGWALCDGLAQDVVDKGTGELVRAVPVDVLRDVLPACGTQRLTSSRWRLEGLQGRVPIDAYRRQEPAEYVPAIEVTPFDRPRHQPAPEEP